MKAFEIRCDRYKISSYTWTRRFRLESFHVAAINH